MKQLHITSKKDLPDTIEELQKFTWDLILRYQQLQERYAVLSKQRFGQSSEKMQELDAVQLEMDELLSQLQQTEQEKKDEESFDVITIEKHTRKRRRPGHNTIPEDIETVTIVHDIPEEEKTCECCNSHKSKIGVKQHKVVVRIPAHYKLEIHERPVWGCQKCKTGVTTADPIVLPIPKSIADVSLLCFVIFSKYLYHLPLYRIQRQIFHESRIWFTRSTMVSWLRALFKSVRRIHYELMAEYKHCKLKHADESPINVRHADVKGKHHQGRMWVGLGHNDLNDPVTAVFHYDNHRSGEAAIKFLKGSSPGDILMVDDCPSYNKPVKKYDLIILNCMAHARRKFKEAYDCGYKKEYCATILRKFAQLYRVERIAAHINADADKRYYLRQRLSEPVISQLHELLTNPGFTVLPGNKLGIAINYMLSNWEKLTRYIENGLYPIDNNPVERIIRRLAIGRKNWMFAGSDNGAKWCAAYYSIFATCLLNGVNPEEYLPDVLMRLAIRPEDADVKDLLPVAWARQNNKDIKSRVDYPEN